MIIKNRTGALLFSIFALILTANASANNSTKQTAKPELNKAQLAAQKAQMHAAYQRLIKLSEQKAVAKKVAIAKKAKSSLVSSTFKARNKSSLASYDKRLKVTATAYTSHVGQTDSTPNIAAWGDRLKPGMKVIAVSRDLLNVYGLKHKQKVRIKGLEGEYLVLDKMNKRWRKKIDIYMGMNKKKAFRWGRRQVEILWDS